MKWTVPALVILALLPGCDTSKPAQPVAEAPAAPAAPPPVPGTPMFPELVSFRPGNLPEERCASDAVIEADQFIRLHTYLMVTGLSCQTQLNDPNLFVRYSEFTAAHGARIRDAQNVLGQFLGRQLRGSNARLFDTYRTEIANDESKLVSDVSTERYCEARRQQVESALGFSDADLQAYLDEAVAHYRSKYNACDAGAEASLPSPAAAATASPGG